MKIDIYMTSFFRREMTARAIREIHERTEPGTFQIHIYDNGSDKETRDYLYSLLEEEKIVSLVLDSRNTGCLYNKLVFHAMTESENPYYIVTDNDIFPPKLSPDWLSQMVGIMDSHPNLAMLTPHINPVFLMTPEPLIEGEDIVYCKAVGNALKLVRRSMFPLNEVKQKLEAYGDDGLVSAMIREAGHQVAFCKDIFVFHAGQTEGWGYKQEELEKDLRKKTVGGQKNAYESQWMVISDTYEGDSAKTFGTKQFILAVDPETYVPKDRNFYWI